MDVLLNLGLACAGIILLCVGADRLVSGAVSLASRFGISGFVIGLTVVAYGTSTPELAAAIQAAILHQPGIILGNVVGSNIANIAMVLGAATTLGVISASRRTITRDAPIVLGVSLLLCVVSLDGLITWIDGALLLGVLVAFTVYTFHKPRPQNTVSYHNGSRPYRSVCMTVLGAALLYVGAILTIPNSVIVAESLGVPHHIIGITVIAVGTSLPELITTVTAVRKGRTDIGVANIIGSNILNVLFIVGVAAGITEIVVDSDMWLHYGIMISFCVALFVLRRWVGPTLIASYGIYLAFILV